jgi:hypothetical protein
MEVPDYVSARQALADGLPGVAGVKAERLLKRKGWTRVETRQLATFAAEAWTRAEEGARVCWRWRRPTISMTKLSGAHRPWR